MAMGEAQILHMPWSSPGQSQQQGALTLRHYGRAFDYSKLMIAAGEGDSSDVISDLAT